jgi:hypothetical protein
MSSMPTISSFVILLDTETGKLSSHHHTSAREILAMNGERYEVAPDSAVVDMTCGIDVQRAIPVREAEKRIVQNWQILPTGA